MADNVKFQSNRPATPTEETIVATDKISGVDFQRMKLTLGADGVNDGDVSSTNPMPIGIYDADGNAIESHVDADGERYLGVAAIQAVHGDDNNSSTTNLTAANSYTFTGTATSTLGVVGLQWSLKTDQNCTVYIDQSPDGTNWDITDSFEYYASLGGDGGTVQAVNSYWRIRVILSGTTATTYFRLQGVLCPNVEVVPRSLSTHGRLKTESHLTGVEGLERHVHVTPLESISVADGVRLIGVTFDGTTKDPNFWAETVTGTGAVAQSGGITLTTGTTANSTAKYNTTRSARFVAGSTHNFYAFCKFTTAGTSDNVRRIGPYDSNDGFFFQLDGTTLSVGSRIGASDTLVSSGSFNGVIGSTYSINTSYHKLMIEWGAGGAFFYIDNVLVHKLTMNKLTGKLTLPITVENINDNDSIVNVAFDVLVTAILRMGQLQTNPTYYHLAGNAATHVLKRGAGVLHKVVYNNTTGTSLTIYDNIEASGSVIGIITTASAALGEWDYSVPFSTGLTLVTVGNGLDATIVYE